MTRDRYHHGHLKRAAVDAGLAMIAAGEAELGLRALAGRLGVSAAALYRHFAGRHALMAAVAAQGFTLLREELAAAGSGADPTERLLAVCRAYMAFGEAQPGIYRLIFAANHFGSPEDPVLGPAALGAFAELEGGVAACRPDLDDAGLRDVATALWAAMHGAVSLREVRLLPVGKHAADADRAGAARAVAALVARALAVGPSGTPERGGPRAGGQPGEGRSLLPPARS